MNSPTVHVYSFNVALRFAATNTSVRHDDITAFAHAVPWLCTRTDPTISIEIVSVSMSAATDLIITVNIRPREVPEDLFEESRRMGIRDPIAAQAGADLMLWIASLRRIGDSPLQTAWNQWRASRGDAAALPESVPIMMLEFNFTKLSKVEPLRQQSMTLYDGPTQTST